MTTTALSLSAADERDEQRKRDELALLLLLLAEIAADHDERERGLIALFLATARRALRRVRDAVRGGHNWLKSLRDVWRGNQALNLPDPAPTLARGMADSFARGEWRASLAAGVPREFKGPAASRVELYLPQAERALDGTADGLANRIEALLDESPRLPGSLEAIEQAFRLAGWAVDNPWGARRAAAAAVLPAYSGGMAAAYGSAEIGDRITGLHYAALLDKGTTKICRAYNGVELPLDHPWWRSHFPMNHWGCRSVAIPILGDFTPTENPPWVPAPDPGFGTMPANAYPF